MRILNVFVLVCLVAFMSGCQGETKRRVEWNFAISEGKEWRPMARRDVSKNSPLRMLYAIKVRDEKIVLLYSDLTQEEVEIGRRSLLKKISVILVSKRDGEFVLVRFLPLRWIPKFF